MKFLPILIFIALTFPLVAQAWNCVSFPSRCRYSECWGFCDGTFYEQKPNSFSICCFIEQVGWWLQMLGWGLAVIAIVAGGIMYTTAGGSEDQVGKAKKIVINGLIGAIIIFLAGFIIDTLVEILRF